MRHPFLTPTVATLIACSPLALLRAQVPSSNAAAADAAPLPTLAYQGRLLEGSLAVTGARSFTFVIEDSTGAALWTSGAQTLTITDGLYSTVLGATGMPALPTSVLGKAGLKLHITVSGQVLAPDVDIVPAFQSRSAWEVVGTFSGDLTGTQNQMLVMKLQGIPLDLTTTPPSTGQALVFDGSKWTASSVAGTQGPSGPQGPVGVTGATGAAGPQGPAGVTGATGAAGPQGPAGVTGATGAAGPQGLPGLNGLSGATGATGAVGATGASPFTLNGSDAVLATGSVGLGVNSPDTSALLDLTSTTKGFLPPRMTGQQRTAIAAPAAGLMVFQTDGTAGLYQFDGAAWSPVGGSSSSGTVTSVAAGTGLTGGPITGSGTLSLANTTVAAGQYARANVTVDAQGRLTAASNGAAINLALEVSGTLPLANGGTGATTADGALNALLPSQSSNSGKYLTTNGSAASWGTPSASVTSDASYNTMAGTGALGSTTGSNNTAFGYNAINATSSASGNTVLGSLASQFATTPENTVVGYRGLKLNTTGGNNTAIGRSALEYLVTGSGNVALGHSAARASDPSNFSNTIAIGMAALTANTTGGDSNIGIGSNAMLNVTSGYRNLAIGTFSGSILTTGYQNVLLGNWANVDASGSAAINRIAIGYNATNSTDNSILIGNTSVTKAVIKGIYGTTLSGTQTVVIDANGQLGSTASGGGTLAVSGGGTGATTLAAGSVLLGNGTSALGAVAPGTSGNVLTSNGSTWTSAAPAASGGGGIFVPDPSYLSGKVLKSDGSSTPVWGSIASNAGPAAAEGSVLTYSDSLQEPIWVSPAFVAKNSVTAGGSGALSKVLSNQAGGSQSVAFGSNALASLTSGVQNCAFGDGALDGRVQGSYNTAIGFGALRRNPDGSNPWGDWNTALGYLAGSNWGDSVHDSIIIGTMGKTGVGDSNTIRIGKALVNGSPEADGYGQNRTFIAGIAGITSNNDSQLVTITAEGQLISQPDIYHYGTIRVSGSLPYGTFYVNKFPVDSSASSSAVAIRADGDVAGYNFLATSDARVKDVVDRSSGVEDLDTLGRLQITNYRFKDRVQHGETIHKKVIAQEVEAVYPVAVKKTVDFIPNIYRMSVTVSYSDGRLTVGLDQPHGLQGGEKVRLIGEQGPLDLPVAQVLDATHFVVANHPGTDKAVFVFGTQVKDFRVVDYDALNTLNISATQELARQMKVLQEENLVLRRDLAEIKALLKR